MLSPKTQQMAKQLETSFCNDFVNKPQELPSMKELIEYSERYPRLLTLRDSPLKDLSGPNVPMGMVHDWYINEAISYIEENAQDILNKWINTNYMIVNEIENINRFQKLGNLIDQLYSLYERIHIVPNMQFSEDSPMSSSLLKYRLNETFSTIIHQILPKSIKQLQDDYYIYIYNQFFAITPEEKEKERMDDVEEDDNDDDIEKEKDNDGDMIMDEKENSHNNNILSPRTYTKNYYYKKSILTWILSQNLDESLPELVDVNELSDELIQDIVTNAISNYLDTDHVNTPSNWNSDSTLLENSSAQQQSDDENITYHYNNNTNDYTINENDDSDNNMNNSMNDFDNDIEMNPTDSVSNSLNRFIDICQKSYIIRLIPSLENIIEKWIHERFSGTWKEEYTRNILDIQLNWFRSTVLPWLSHILSSPPSFTSSDNINPWYRLLQLKITMEYKIYNEFYQSRTKDIFDIFLDYPSSLPALKELIIVIEKTNQMEGLRDAIIKSLNKRLLHQGASAIDIIQQYITCIKCLKMFDPTCQVLFPVVELVEQYMITYRNDTAHGVLEVIRNPKDYDLDLSNDYCYVFVDGELDRESLPLYEHAAIEKLQRKSEDLIAMLISLCESINTFIEGYQEILSKSLLTVQNYDIEHEMFHLENIKQRFPQNTLIGCDIMIKDIDDGRRLDRQIHESSDDIEPSFHSFILSKKYWPEITNGETLKLVDEDEMPIPIHLKRSIPIYEEGFKTIKQSRNLQWLPSHGSVSLELEYKNRTIEFTVKPTDALVINILSKDKLLNKSEIIEKTKLNEKLVMKSLNYWQKNGIIELQADGSYNVIE